MIAKKVRNIFSVLTSICVLLVGVLSGCGDPYVRFEEGALILEEYENSISEELKFFDPDKTVQISGWLDESCVKNLMAFLAEEYPDYTFEYKYISKNSYEPIIDAELASKTATSIVMMTPIMAKKHAKNRYIEDLSEYCQDFKDEGRNAFMYGNEVYAVPCTSDFQCIFYNKEILAQSGQKLPVSFKSFVELCDFMNYEMGIKPMSAGLKDTEKVADTALALLASGYFASNEGKKFGGRLAYGRASFYEEVRPYMSKWQELCIHNVYTRQMCIMDEAAAIEEFAAGESFMYMGGLYDYNRIVEANPNIKLGTMAVYSDFVGRAALIGGCNCGFAVNSYAPNKEIAKAVVESISTEKGQRALWQDRQGSQTYLKGVIFDNPDEFDTIRPLEDAGRMIMPWYSWGDHSSEIYETFGEELQKVVMGDKSLDTAFKSIDERVGSIIKEN